MLWHGLEARTIHRDSLIIPTGQKTNLRGHRLGFFALIPAAGMPFHELRDQADRRWGGLVSNYATIPRDPTPAIVRPR
jgi:hypothetical protein